MFPAIISAGMAIIDKIIPDPKQKAEAKAKLIELEQQGQLKELEASMQVITAEAKSEHWITSAWRPIAALTLVFIIANNYIIYPYLSLFWTDAPKLELPPDLWDLLKLCLTGYIASRGVEKSIRIYKKGEE